VLRLLDQSSCSGGVWAAAGGAVEGLDGVADSGKWQAQRPRGYPWELVVTPCPGAMRFGRCSILRLGLRRGALCRGVEIVARTSRLRWRTFGMEGALHDVYVRERPQAGCYDPFLTSFRRDAGFMRAGDTGVWRVRVDSGCPPHHGMHGTVWEPHVVRVHVDYRSTPDCAADRGPQPPLGYECGAHTWVMEFPRKLRAPEWVVFGQWRHMAGPYAQRVRFTAPVGWD